MTPEHLDELLTGGESLSVEFKSERTRPVNDAELVEAVVCLSNRPGDASAWLLIGVEDDGRITRREAAELCQLGPQQATRLLRRLVQQRRIRLHGSGKGSWYSLGEQKYARERNDRSPGGGRT